MCPVCGMGEEYLSLSQADPATLHQLWQMNQLQMGRSDQQQPWGQPGGSVDRLLVYYFKV